jgi:hypothetical protein
MFKVHLPTVNKKAILVAIALMLIQLPVGIIGGSSVLAAPNENANVRAHEQAAQKQANSNQAQSRHSSLAVATNTAAESQAKKDEHASNNSKVESAAAQSNVATEHDHKISICHATKSTTNPYVHISIAKTAAYHAHIAHQDGEDIIPPFGYNGQTYSQNWDSTGQAIHHNGCKAGGSILGETVSGNRGGGNPVQTGNVAAGQLANTGANITLPLFAAAALIVATAGLATPVRKLQQA